MNRSINLLQFLGLMITLFLFWAFQSNHSIPAAKHAEELSDKLFEEGMYEASLTKVLEAKTIYEKAKNWEKIVKCLRQAYSCSAYISPDDSEIYLRQAVKLSNQYLSNNHLIKGKVYQSFGEWYSMHEAYDSSIIALKVAVKIFDNLEERESKAWSVITLASSCYYNNQLEIMHSYLIEVEKFAEQHQLNSDIFDATYSLLGVYHYTMSDIAKAIHYNNRSLQLLENKADKNNTDSLTLASVYNNQGLNYIEHFNLQRAAFCLLQTLKILQSIGEPITENIDVHINYSEVLYRLNNYKQSLAILENIKDIKESDYSKQQYLEHKKNIYDIFIRNYLKLKELEPAAFYVDESIKLYRNEDELPSNLLESKGRLFFYQKKFEEAEKVMKSIIIRHERAFSNSNKDEYLSTYNNISTIYSILGQALYALGKYEEALLSFQKSLAVNLSDFEDINDINQPTSIQNAFRAEQVLISLHQKAITLEAINTEKSKQQALNAYQVASEWMETMRQSMAFDASKENLNSYSDIYKNAVSLAAELYQSTNKEEYLDMAFEWSEKEKAVILLDNLIGEQGKLATNVPEDLLEREANLKRNLTFFQQKRLELEDEKDSDNYQLNEQRFTDANIQLAKLKDTLQTYYQSYFNLEYQSSIATISTVQKDLLQPQQALVQYFTTDSLFYVFVIDKENSQLLTLPKGAKESQQLEDLQANLQQTNVANQTERENFQDYVRLAHQGYQHILEPIISRLPKDVKELVVVPDAALNYLPFEALLSEAVSTQKVNYLGLPYALHDYQFHYGYSGTLLLENQRQYQQLETNDKILAFAPPYASNNPIAQRGNMRTLRGNVAQLKGTAKEIQAIAQYFDGKFDCSPTATKDNFTKQAPDFGILHLAMHGQPSLDNPSEAHLIFSNLNNETNKDNLLHHYEITALETKAQLAVLSACETGVGKEIEGEGVMSLGRGFMYTGIPSVVMSLWKMNDQSTSELMPLFYQHLAEGMRKDQALHQAKLTYLDNALPEQAHPFYWSGFVSLGDAQPIKKKASIFSMKHVGIAFLVVLVVSLGFRFFSIQRQ